MARTWTTILVFISSTFRDMHAERDHLVKVVFPALRESLEKDRIHLVDIDLRWGVTAEQADNDLALDLCLQQIDECRPFFIGILGERYGWVPTRMPDFDRPEYGWIQGLTGKSITELEILYGVLNDEAMRERSFFYFRDPAFIEELGEEHRRIFAEGPTDDELAELPREEAEARAEERRGKLRLLKQRIIAAPTLSVFGNYPCRWDEGAYDRPTRSPGRLVALEEFGERVRTQLEEAIRTAPELQGHFSALTAEPDDRDGLGEEAGYHERFIESRTRVYVGRDAIHQQLLDYLAGDEPKPLLLTGPSGSGKSSVLARLYREVAEDYDLAIAHFVGASPTSTELRQMLRRFCLSVRNRFALTDTVEHEGAEPETVPAELPQDMNELVTTFRDWLARVPEDQRVFIAIDALNQLEETDYAHNLTWLPRELPPQVRMVVSCIDDAGRDLPTLDSLRGLDMPERQVNPLTDEERFEIAQRVPSLSAKTLDPEQIGMLLENPATQNPLYLVVALEELRGFGSFEMLNGKIQSFPRMGGQEGIDALFIQVIERLEEEFDTNLVRSALSLLASARHGLSERELQDLLLPSPTGRGAGGEGSPQSGVRNPQSDDLYPVLRQIRPYLQHRGDLLDFFHRNLYKAARSMHLDTPEKQRDAHVRLAEFFDGQDYWLESREEQRERARRLPSTPRPSNVRKVEELPWQRLRAAQSEREEDFSLLEDLFMDWQSLEAKTEAGLVFELADDCRAAVRALPAEHERRRFLDLIEQAIRRDIHFIARHVHDYPQALFQCLWNSCWWYDCPELPKYLMEPEDGWSPASAPWLQDGPKLHEWMDRWRQGSGHTISSQSAIRNPQSRMARPWLRSARPPTSSLAGPERMRLTGHADGVTSVAVSGDRIVSASEGGPEGDNAVRVWDAQTGQIIHILEGHTGLVNSVAVSGDRIVSGSEDKTVRVWDAQTGQTIHILEGHTETVRSVALEGDRIVSGSGIHLAPGSDTTVRVWDAQTGQAIRTLEGHTETVSSVALSGDCIVSGSEDKTVRVWDAHTGQTIHSLEGHSGHVERVAVSGDCIVSGSRDKTVRVWDAQTGQMIHTLEGHTSSVENLAVSGDRIVSGSGFDSVRVWDAHTGQLLHTLEGRVGSYVALSGDRIVSGPYDDTVGVWDVHTGQLLHTLDGHRVCYVAVSGDRIVTGSGDGSIHVWDAQTGQTIHTLKGHTYRMDSVAVSGDRIVSRFRLKAIIWDLATGERLGGGARAAEGRLCGQAPYIAAEEALETVVVDRNGQAFSWFPTPLTCSARLPVACLACHPDGLRWAGRHANHVYLICLEDAPGEEQPSDGMSGLAAETDERIDNAQLRPDVAELPWWQFWRLATDPQTSPATQDEADTAKLDSPMTLHQHLEELWRRLSVVLLWWLAATVLAGMLTEGSWFSRIAQAPSYALLMSYPALCYHAWQFVRPALRGKEPWLLLATMGLIPIVLVLLAWIMRPLDRFLGAWFATDLEVGYALLIPKVLLVGLLARRTAGRIIARRMQPDEQLHHRCWPVLMAATLVALACPAMVFGLILGVVGVGVGVGVVAVAIVHIVRRNH